jgi:hypothetical protein
MSDVLAELKRELAMRQKCFPRWVADGKLKQSLADHRILMISQAIGLIESIQPQQQSLFEEKS